MLTSPAFTQGTPGRHRIPHIDSAPATFKTKCGLFHTKCRQLGYLTFKIRSQNTRDSKITSKFQLIYMQLLVYSWFLQVIHHLYTDIVYIYITYFSQNNYTCLHICSVSPYNKSVSS